LHRYYLSSTPLMPERFAHAVHALWSIDNGVHWVLATAFDEDRVRTRTDHGAENLAIIGKLTLDAPTRARPDIFIRRKRQRCGWSDAFARSIIGQMP
jgi:predicted transposase YbfD/YdcC